MTSKEKAQELVRQMLNVNESFNYDIEYMSESMAKDSALICVDEVMNQFIGIHNKFKEAKIIDGDVKESANYIYWIEVKQEIKAL